MPSSVKLVPVHLFPENFKEQKHENCFSLSFSQELILYGPPIHILNVLDFGFKFGEIFEEEHESALSELL